MHGLSPQLIKAFVLVAETGTISAAASQLRRTPAAISMQIRQLEESIGATLFQRANSGLTLTGRGRILLHFAREITELSERAIESVRGTTIASRIRLGVVEDLAATSLVDILSVFRSQNPHQHIDITVESNNALGSLFASEELDVVVCDTGSVMRQPLSSWREHLHWVARSGLHVADEASLPILMFTDSCVWHSPVLSKLADCRRDWHVASRSATLVAASSAVRAGIGVAPMTGDTVPPGCEIVDETFGLPAAVEVRMGIYVAKSRPEARPLADFLVEFFAAKS